MTKVTVASDIQDGGAAPENSLPKLWLVPARFTKVVHFIRHGEGYHNVAGDKNRLEYRNAAYMDAHLTDRGWKQTRQLAAEIRASSLRVDLVVCSPMMRALETAAGVFGNHDHATPSLPLLMEAQDVEAEFRTKHPAISAEGSPPFLALETCREKLNGDHPCDNRRSLSVYKKLFPAVDFSHVQEEDDVLYKPGHTETREELRARGRSLLTWLLARPEQHIAVVSHSGFLTNTLSQFSDYFMSVGVKGELTKHIENCELRSVIVCNNGL